MKRIGVLVSGGGTNLQALLDAQDSGVLKSGRVVTVVSNKAGVYALERAARAGVDSAVILKADCRDDAEFQSRICRHMRDAGVDLIVLAGFLAIVGGELLKEYRDRIINIHPSLIPSFCGDGYYGLRVHRAALDYGVKVTGATVHLVNEVTDGGKIILQKAVDILEDDTPESLQKRVMEEAEWVLLPRAAELLCATM